MAPHLGLKPIEGAVATVVVVAGTVANIAGTLDGSALTGIYAAALGYCFGIINGTRRRLQGPE